MERREKIYSLHKYIDENGIPDRERILSEREKPWMPGHLNPKLRKIWRNQPKEVQDVVTDHLGRCGECKEEFEEKS
ncbi:MAG: hypothetical protein HYX22_03485 [Candidatus Yanofskybacteria bacterium]|nr:hypothetical protein [Candidatus Yanofskybacteria bacterium]